MAGELTPGSEASRPQTATEPRTATEPNPESSSEAAKVPGIEANAVGVLVVDDDPEMVRSLTRTLGGFGHRVVAVQSGDEALRALDAGTFEVVLSDIGMPKMDGFALLRAVRAIDVDVPIVLLTGDPTVSSAARALEVGAFRYVTKPVNPKDLCAVIEKAARMYRMARVKHQAAQLLGRQQEQDRDHATLERSFQLCLQSLWMAYQPILDAKTQRIFGYEALMRSREPDLPHPGAVLDAAERLRQLSQLGQTVRQLTAANIPGAGSDLVFFVNLHVRDLLDETLLSLHSPLAPYAQRIILEVTERASLAEVPEASERISELREMGYRIAVDDLGAGYAGLTSFALLEPEFVKLDMSLVRDVHLNATKTKIVRSMINLAKDMGMMVVGEGIECQEERDALVALGCDFLQGYHHAMPAEPFVGARW